MNCYPIFKPCQVPGIGHSTRQVYISTGHRCPWGALQTGYPGNPRSPHPINHYTQGTGKSSEPKPFPYLVGLHNYPPKRRPSIGLLVVHGVIHSQYLNKCRIIPTQRKKGNQLDSLSRVRHVTKMAPFGERVQHCWTPFQKGSQARPLQMEPFWRRA